MSECRHGSYTKSPISGYCYKCEINELRNRNRELEVELRMYKQKFPNFYPSEVKEALEKN